MIELHNLRPAKGSNRDRKRVGRGPGSGKGKTSGRGENGQNSRSGGGVPAWFEGGQMPLQRRIPKRGFTSRNRISYEVVNLMDLAVVSGDVNPSTLAASGLVRTAASRVKILGTGEVSAALNVSAHKLSASAHKKIEAAGGTVTVIAYGTAASSGDEEE